MWRIRMLVLFMYLRQNSHRYSLGSLQDDKQTVHATIHNQEMKMHEQFMNENTHCTHVIHLQLYNSILN